MFDEFRKTCITKGLLNLHNTHFKSIFFYIQFNKKIYLEVTEFHLTTD